MNYQRIEKDLTVASKEYQPKRRDWTSRELEILKKFYRKVDTQLLAAKLRRSLASINNQVRRCGI